MGTVLPQPRLSPKSEACLPPHFLLTALLQLCQVLMQTLPLQDMQDQETAPASHSSSEGGAETTSYRPLLRPPSPGDDTEKARLPGPWQWGGMPNCRRVRPPLPSRAVWSKARGGQLRGMSHRGSRAPSKF